MKPDIFSRVNVPSTCKLCWDHVDPDQKQWFCSHCRHQVHNLSAMTRSEARRFLRSPSAGRRCISFLQDDQGGTIFRKTTSLFGSIGTSIAWLVSALFVLLAPGCATSSQKQAPEKTTTVAESKTQPDQSTAQKTEKPQRRWTGY